MASANTGAEAKRKAFRFAPTANPVRRYPRLDLVRRVGAKRGWHTGSTQR